ncbi:MAG: minor capsid protein [Gammaproteobacteria bacterium]|nr:minor capsid protein [Gammaproteobacteria bacterium]MBU0771784.1 minor capsid protein [Gammaproteobacteria bacterium]MBU0855540.1 minor capsid protein [Gammaproteobacteria bacterium]MBU1846102.1 minor capsid protein [Gammaproteobacteria bacterium]
MVLTLDRRKKDGRRPPRPARAEEQYGRSLRALARQVGELINAFPAGDPQALPTIEDMLRRYAEALTPWALGVAERMLLDVNARDLANWRALTAEMQTEIRREILEAPTGERTKELLAQQVTLIKSLPLEAAQRVHELTIRGLEDGTRAKEIAAEIMRSGEVAESRAMLIARTEVARSSSVLTQARAENAGSTGYIWRTARDGDVRPSHKAMNGRFVRWGEPPTLDNLRGHAGCLPNCRCYAEPVIPD